MAAAAAAAAMGAGTCLLTSLFRTNGRVQGHADRREVEDAPPNALLARVAPGPWKRDRGSTDGGMVRRTDHHEFEMSAANGIGFQYTTALPGVASGVEVSANLVQNLQALLLRAARAVVSCGQQGVERAAAVGTGVEEGQPVECVALEGMDQRRRRVVTEA